MIGQAEWFGACGARSRTADCPGVCGLSLGTCRQDLCRHVGVTWEKS